MARRIRVAVIGAGLGGLAAATPQAVRVLEGAGCDVVFIETVGVGQAEVEVAQLAHEPGRLLGLRDICLKRPPPTLAGHTLGLVLPRAVADDDCSPSPCQLDRDRAADSSRPPGDERVLAL